MKLSASEQRQDDLLKRWKEQIAGANTGAVLIAEDRVWTRGQRKAHLQGALLADVKRANVQRCRNCGDALSEFHAKHGLTLCSNTCEIDAARKAAMAGGHFPDHPSY